MTYVFERETKEQVRVRADDEESARRKADELSDSEWFIVNDYEVELIRVVGD